MTLNYLGYEFELTELFELGGAASHDIVAIFKINNDPNAYSKYEYVDYFYGASEDEDTIKKNAISYINEWLEGHPEEDE